MGQTNVLNLPLAIAAFLLEQSDVNRKGMSMIQSNIETSTPAGTWNATNFPSDGTKGVRVIFSPNQTVAVGKQNRLNALIDEKNQLKPVADARPAENTPKPTAKQITEDAKKASDRLKDVELEIDILQEEMIDAGTGKAFTIPFIDEPYVAITSADALVAEKKPTKAN